MTVLSRAGLSYRSRMQMVEHIHQVLDVLMEVGEPRVVCWDGRILRVHRLDSRKGRQIFHSLAAYPGVLGVFDQRARYRDLADPLGELLGVVL